MPLIEALEERILLSGWYVSPTGSDSNPGNSIKGAFATIQQAANVARAGDTVFIRGGTYRQTVIPAHSGTAAKPITFRALANQQVIIDGADPVGGWTSVANGVFQTSGMTWDLGDGNNQLFAGGQMLPEARWPNTSPNIADLWQPTFATISGATVEALADGTMSATVSVPALTDPAGTW